MSFKFRNYNEDRVAIILNIMKPKNKRYTVADWPKCSFFGVYDGHGGSVCADFLRDYLHQLVSERCKAYLFRLSKTKISLKILSQPSGKGLRKPKSYF